MFHDKRERNLRRGLGKLDSLVQLLKQVYSPMGRQTFVVEEFPWPLAAGFADALEVSLNGSTTDFVEWSWNYGLALCGNS